MHWNISAELLGKDLSLPHQVWLFAENSEPAYGGYVKGFIEKHSEPAHGGYVKGFIEKQKNTVWPNVWQNIFQIVSAKAQLP